MTREGAGVAWLPKVCQRLAQGFLVRHKNEDRCAPACPVSPVCPVVIGLFSSFRLRVPGHLGRSTAHTLSHPSVRRHGGLLRTSVFAKRRLSARDRENRCREMRLKRQQDEGKILAPSYTVLLTTTPGGRPGASACAELPHLVLKWISQTSRLLSSAISESTPSFFLSSRFRNTCRTRFHRPSPVRVNDADRY